MSDLQAGIMIGVTLGWVLGIAFIILVVEITRQRKR